MGLAALAPAAGIALAAALGCQRLAGLLEQPPFLGGSVVAWRLRSTYADYSRDYLTSEGGCIGLYSV